MSRLLLLQKLQYEFLGPMYVSAAAQKRGHECRLAIGDDLSDFERKIETFKPDLIGFSIMTGGHEWALDMARKIKARYGLPNIFGGAHPTFFPKFLEEDGVDMIIRGEGEIAAAEVLDAMDSGADASGIANLGCKRGGVPRVNPLRRLPERLDDFAFPDRRLYNELDGKMDRSVRNVLTSRGCPFHCSFCFEDAMREMYKGKGKYVRIRDIDKIIEECVELKNSTGVETIYFADDLFGMNKEWLYEFLKVYRERVGLRFICLVRADLVAADKDYAANLARAGCENVFFGVESGNEELRNKVLMKGTTDEQIHRAARLLHGAGIRFRTYNIMGLPGETLEDAFKTVQLNIDIRADFPWCSLFSPIPGLALTDYAVKGGWLPSDFNSNEINQSFFLENPLKLPQKKEIQNLQKFFQLVVRFPWTFPIIKKLIRLPANPIFTILFGFMYFVNYIRSERRGFLKTFFFGLRNWRHVLAKQ